MSELVLLFELFYQKQVVSVGVNFRDREVVRGEQLGRPIRRSIMYSCFPHKAAAADALLLRGIAKADTAHTGTQSPPQ